MPTISATQHDADPRLADSTVVQATIALIKTITPADLTLPTPCAGWDLGDLLAHMTVHHRGFAAAAAGRGGDPALWRPAPVGHDFFSTYSVAAGRLLLAFADDSVLDRAFALPEISTERTFPGRMAIGFHLVDYVAHGWDVATALGVRFELPDEVIQAALPIAEMVPGGPARTAPGAAFGPVLPVADDAAPLDRILSLLGRKP